MATVHPHLLFAKEPSVLADIHHPNITESNPKNKGGEKKNKAQQSLKRGGVVGKKRGRERMERGLEEASVRGKNKRQVKLVDTEKRFGSQCYIYFLILK